MTQGRSSRSHDCILGIEWRSRKQRRRSNCVIGTKHVYVRTIGAVIYTWRINHGIAFARSCEDIVRTLLTYVFLTAVTYDVLV